MELDRIKELREDNDLTQKKLALELGVDVSTYKHWENGRYLISLKRLNDVCNYFEISLDYACKFTSIKNYPFINTIIDKKVISYNLKSIRKLHNDKHENLAHILGVPTSTYAGNERGDFLISLSLLIKFCRYYNVSIDYICGRTDRNYLSI